MEYINLCLIFMLYRTKEDNPDFEARSHLIKSLHSEYGGKLVDSLVRAAVTTLPSYTYHDIGDVIHECLQHDRVCQYVRVE